MTDFTLKPVRALLLVKEDPAKDRTDSGLHLPDDSKVPWTGVIQDRGPQALEENWVGRRVMWRPRGGFLVGKEGIGRGGALRLVDASLVLGFLDERDILSMASADWAKYAKAPAFHLLVERVEQPVTRGSIVLPDGARTHVRSNEVLVRHVGPGVEGYEAEDRLLISFATGQELTFGDRGEVKLLKITPSDVIARVLVPDASVVVHGEDPASLLPEFPIPEETEYSFDEGDARGIR